MTRGKSRLLLAAVLLTAAVLRFWGLTWDDKRHLHPDERFLSMVADGIAFPGSVGGYFDSAHSPLNPFNRKFEAFVYGTFPVFLTKAVAAVYGQDGYDSTFLVGRILSSLFDLLTVWIAYRIARRFASRGTSLVAASFVAFCPLGIQLSHFWGVDSFLTTFSAIALLGCVRIARGKTDAAGIVGTGAAVGLAVACKITGLALLAPAGLAVLGPALAGLRDPGRSGRLRALGRAAIRGLALLAVTFAVTRVALPYAFLGPVRVDPRYVHAIRELTNLTRGFGFPPQVQWAGRTPLFAFRNMILWGAGVFFGIPATAALLWAPWAAWRRRDLAILLLWTHAAIVFGYHATASTKNIRYFHPAYPALAVLAALLLSALAARTREGAAAGSVSGRRWARFLPVGAAAGTLLFGIAFCSIYRHPHPRGVASQWMYDHIRAPARVANEDWDDGLPFSQPGYSVEEYAGPVLHMYYPDSAKKIEEIVTALTQADWIAITSNRAYGSVTRVPDVFPMTREYYRSLFAGRLGFRKAADFVSYPGIGPLRIPDDTAEETFTVYDHPRVLLFQKTREFDPGLVRGRLAAALTGNPPVMDEWGHWPRSQRHVVDPILPGRSGQSPAAAPTPLSDELIGSWPAAVLFYLAVLAVGACAFPLCFRFFSRLDDRGFGFARIAGLAAVTYLMTIAVQGRILENGRPAAVLAVVALAVAGAAVGWRRRHALAAFLRGRRRALIFSEGVFLFGFLLFTLLRAWNPEIFWGEKPMDFSILNILVRTRALPASDPWFAGAPLGYYTFGQEMIAVLSLLTGLSTRYTFNLAFGLIGGATLQGAFALVRNWTGSRRAGVLGAAFVALLGNLAGLREWWLNQPARHEARHLDWHYFWATSRVTGSTTINEYPLWSLIFADLHAHVLAFPFFLLVLACGLELVRRHADPGASALGRVAAAAALGAAVAAHALTNAWDVPLLIGLITLVCVAAAFSSGRLTAGGAGRAALSYALAAVTSAALVLPLWVRGGGAPGYGRNVDERAAGADILTVFGFFIYLALAWWLVAAARRWIAAGGRRGAVVLLAGAFAVLLGVAAFRIPDLFFLVAVVLFLAAAVAFERAPEDRLACGLLASAFFLILFAQRFYIFDRGNTFFKLYMEAWFLFAIGTAILVFGRRDRPGAFSTWPWPLRAAGFLLAGIALFTTATAGRGGVGENRPSLPDGVRRGAISLDGLAYLERWHPGEYRAVLWLRNSVPGTPVNLEAQGPTYQQFGRISMLTGLPTVLGWEYHVSQRGNPQAEIDARKDAVRAIYSNPNANAVEGLLRRYHVGYVTVGALERQTYPAAGLAKFAAATRLFDVAYENPDVRIYRVRGGDTDDVVLPRHEALPATSAEGVAAEAPLESEPEELPAISAAPAPDTAPWARLREPRDAAVDDLGRVWVADFGHSRLRVYDGAGGLLGGWGGKGDGAHGFRELCGVAVRAADLYVADTWNGRVERFGLDGTWKASAKELYGPRGVAVAPDGRVWVADTGNNRLVLYDAALAGGRPVGKKGKGAGEFDNPVGIAVGPSGRLYVADTNNRRVQVLDAAGAFIAEWRIAGWTGGGSEPHVEVDSDETVYVSDPPGDAILEFAPDGRLRRRFETGFDGRKFSRPTGLGIDRAARTLYVSDAGSDSVSIVRLPGWDAAAARLKPPGPAGRAVATPPAGQ
ncbi:MAG: DUF2298 domain-containing protein [Acidobacteriota bacterium]